MRQMIVIICTVVCVVVVIIGLFSLVLFGQAEVEKKRQNKLLSEAAQSGVVHFKTFSPSADDGYLQTVPDSKGHKWVVVTTRNSVAVRPACDCKHSPADANK